MQNRYPSRVNWENEPSINTPINEDNLNRMDNALFNIAADIVGLDNDMFKSVSYNPQNGVFTFVKGNGQTFVLDTALEKIATNFRYEPSTQSLILTLADGTTQSVDLSDMITNYDFEDSGVVRWSIVGGKVKAEIINGSITADKLQPNFLADVTTQANRSEQAVTSAITSETNAKASEVKAKSSEVSAKNSEQICLDAVDEVRKKVASTSFTIIDGILYVNEDTPYRWSINERGILIREEISA